MWASSFKFALFLTWSLISFGSSDPKWRRLVLLLTRSQFFLILGCFVLFENLLLFDARDRNVIFENLILLSRIGLWQREPEHLVTKFASVWLVPSLWLHLLYFFSNKGPISDGIWWFGISKYARIILLLRLCCHIVILSGLWLASPDQVCHHDHSWHLDAVVSHLWDLRSSGGEIRVGAVSDQTLEVQSCWCFKVPGLQRGVVPESQGLVNSFLLHLGVHEHQALHIIVSQPRHPISKALW